MKMLKPLFTIALTLIIALFNVACDALSSHTHGYTWYPVKQATCEQEGQMEGICEECGYKTYTKIDKSSHEYSWTIQKAPTCTEEGASVGYCVHCYTKTEKIIKTLSHQYDSNNICINCGSIKTATYLDANKKLGYTFDEMNQFAYNKGFTKENLVSNYIKSGKDISLSVNKDNNVIVNVDLLTFSIGDIREDFVIQDGLTATVSMISYTTNNSLYVIYVDGSRVLVSEEVTNNMSIAINKQNELLVVMSDRRVVKLGTLPEVLIKHLLQMSPY